MAGRDRSPRRRRAGRYNAVNVQVKLLLTEKPAFERCMSRDRLRLSRRVISMAGNALSHHFASWTVAGDAARFRRHEHVGSFAALQRLMATVAIECLLCVGIDSMFGVIEVCLQQPAVHQDWLRDHGRRVWDRVDLVTKRATHEVRSSDNVHPLLRLVRIGREKHGLLKLNAAVKNFAQLPDLLRNETRHLGVARHSLFQSRVIRELSRQGA